MTAEKSNHEGEFTSLGCLIFSPLMDAASFVNMPMVDRLFVILTYGSDAFFEGGLRIRGTAF